MKLNAQKSRLPCTRHAALSRKRKLHDLPLAKRPFCPGAAVHFRYNFTELAGAIVEGTDPGIHSSRMSDFVYEKVARPLLIWPLDQVVIVAHRTCLGQGASLHEMHSSPPTTMFLDCNSHSFRHVSCC